MNGIALYGEDFFTIKSDYDLYAEELKRLLMTNPGERVGQPYFGVGLRNSLFELATEATANIVKGRIQEQATAYLPMLSLLDITSEIKENSLYISVGFIIKGDLPEDVRILTLEFESEAT